MPAVRIAFLVLSAVASLSLARAAEGNREPARMFTLVNASDESVTALAVGGTEIPLGEPLQGGTTAATVRLPEGGCLRDFQVTFRDGQTRVYDGIDVCRFHRLRLGSWPRPATSL
ncbi:hypothetical protein [Luteibacter yeojuensis]|uniref:Uncharacterized protein n=1 Tax=Luteibacter yeojuensis TaxID=345309 RepID=A0A7X5TP67_9GAMM|nr:hypothetical protein [Luteibacter yeojuensis]NID14735.1 hypothetical protein [Luteibacter yeojuensis]